MSGGTMRVAVLASGTGSNFQALVEQLDVEGSPARVKLLVCNVPGAGVVQRAHALRIPTVEMSHRDWESREAFDAAIATTLTQHRIELVCLAGYMRLLSPALLEPYAGRIINVHPALLPSFPGMHGVRQAIDAGVRVAGCTVHFVDGGTDTGPIIAQAPVAVRPGDDEASLAARIRVLEHKLFPEVVQAIARGEIRLQGRRVVYAEPKS